LSSQTVARRYASALADVVIERGEEKEVQAELATWARMISENRSLLEAFSNPTIAYEQKGKVLNELITRSKVRSTTANFLRILLKNQRLDERAGVVSARIVSARPVSEKNKALLEDRLAGLTGKKPKLSFEIDGSLLGGVVTRIGSTIYDGSVRNQLRRLREELAG
jgi:F-type H+-transporting ATPase subunit delta